MNTIQLNSYSVKLPDCWEELSVKQTKRLALTLLGNDMRKLRAKYKELKLEKNPESISAFLAHSESYHLRIQMLWILMNIRWNFRIAWFVLWRMKAEHYAMILNKEPKLIDWLLHKPLTKQVMPTVQVGLINLIGPRDYLGGVSFGEFEMAQHRYTAWLKSRSRKHLQMFFQILYRQERHDVPRHSVVYYRDRRKPLNEITSDKDSSRLSKLSESTMLVAVLYWQGCLQQAQINYPYVFTGSSKSKASSNPGELILSLAGSAKRSDVEEIAATDYHNVMIKLNADNRQAALNSKKK
jgi:hypothetical protein